MPASSACPAQHQQAIGAVASKCTRGIRRSARICRLPGEFRSRVPSAMKERWNSPWLCGQIDWIESSKKAISRAIASAGCMVSRQGETP